MRESCPVGLVWCVAVSLLLMCVPTAHGQAASGSEAKRDESQLIQTLSQYGMTELLEHLRETGGVQGVEAELATIGQHRIDANDASLPIADRAAALDKAIAGYETLVTSEALQRNPQRAIWMTELAELLLFDRMYLFDDPKEPRKAAPAFAEFGVPTAAQREQMQRLVPRALELAQGADNALFNLRGELTANEALRNELEASGVLARLNREFRELRTPYVLALAEYDRSLMGDEADVLNQGETGAEARTLRQGAATRLAGVVERSADLPPFQSRARALRGRVLMSQGKSAEAIEDLSAAIESLPADPQAAGAQPLDNLLAQLGRAFALQQSQGLDPAYEALREAEGHPLARYPWPYGLLVTDARFRVAMANAQRQTGEQRRQAIAGAYNEYSRFLDTVEDPRMKGYLENVIAQRQAAAGTGADADELPVSVRADQAERLLNEGLAMRTDDATRDQGVAKLEESIVINEAITQDSATPKAVHAQAMFNLAQARYALDETDVRNIIEVAKLYRETAERHPESPKAEQAIGTAASLFGYLDTKENKPDDVRKEYETTAVLLFGKFRNTEPAFDQAVYYGQQVLEIKRTQEGWRAAADIYNLVPPKHPDYFLAQQRRLEALLEDYRSREPNLRNAVANELEAEIGDVVQVAQAELETAQPGEPLTQRQQRATDALATASLARAGLALESNRAAEALTALEGFEDRFALAAGDLRASASQLRIRAAIAAERNDLALAEAERLMAEKPDAAERVVDDLLRNFEADIDRLQEAALRATSPTLIADYQRQAAAIADTSVELSQLLLQRAKDEGVTGSALLGYQLPLAKALRLTGRPEEARQMLAPLLADPELENDGRLIFNAAETEFAMGASGDFPDYKVVDAEALERAKGFYAKLVGGIRASGSPPFDPPFDRMYWESLLHALAIDGLLGRGASITPTVRQLRISSDDLGGLRRQFEELIQKYRDAAPAAAPVAADAANDAGPQLAAGDRLQTPSQTWLFVLIGVGVLLAVLVAVAIYVATKPRKRRPRPSQQAREVAGSGAG